MARELPLEDHICFALYSANHAMNRVYQRMLHDHKLTYPQYIALVALWQNGAMPVGALGRTLGLESNTLTPLLKRLEAAGYVTRTRNTEDERQVIVSLTEAGQALRAKTIHVPDCILDACGVSPDALADLQAEIMSLRRRLSQK